MNETCRATPINLLPNKKLSELTDCELVGLCKNKDERAFTILMKRHERMVRGMLNKMAPDWNDTADLTQDCFLRMWKGIGNLQNPKAFKSWLCQIVTHVFYDELRKSSRRNPALSLDQSLFSDESEENTTRDLLDTAAGPAELFQRNETTKIVGEAMQMIPDQFRTAMILRDLEDKTYEEISRLTQADLGTVKSRIARARAKVQKVLAPQFGQPAKISA